MSAHQGDGEKVVRLTITIPEPVSKSLRRFLDGAEEEKGARPSTSEIVAEAIDLMLPVLWERLRRRGESPDAALLRRAADLKARLARPDLSRAEVDVAMREASRLLDEGRRELLSQGHDPRDPEGAYARFRDAAIAAYNAGAMRGQRPMRK